MKTYVCEQFVEYHKGLDGELIDRMEMRFMVDNQELDPRLDLVDHAPSGMTFGYLGSGPKQLALAILASAAGDDVAKRFYRDYEADVISRLQEPEDMRGREGVIWRIREKDVLAWVQAREGNGKDESSQV